MKTEYYNVRVLRINGEFVFNERCFMHRSAPRKNYDEWIDASERDRKKFKAQLDVGSNLK